MEVFISHISEEARIAQAFKKWIMAALKNQIDGVFVSSDPHSITLGDKWLETITQAIDESQVMLLLCSQRSINRHWIHFEAGCGWIQRKPVIPICYGGLTRSQLPVPLSALQALDFGEGLPTILMNAICKQLKLPNVDGMLLRGMLDDLKEVIGEGTAELENKEIPRHIDEKQETKEINDQQIEIMVKLAEHNSREDLTARLLGEWMRLHELRVEAQLSKLEEMGLVYASYVVNQEPTYRLAPDGSQLLMDRGAI